MTDETNPSRRRAIGAIAVVGGAVGCAIVGVPTVRLLVAPARDRTGNALWIRTVPLDALNEGEPKRVPLIADRRDAWTQEKAVELGSAWLVRNERVVRAWSTTCPHLGCSIGRSATTTGFECPCHESAFSADGRRLAGPSARDLDALATRIEDGIVFIEYRRFRQGIAEKVAVG